MPTPRSSSTVGRSAASGRSGRSNRSGRSSRSSRNAGGERGSRPLAGAALLETLIGGWRPLARLDVDGFAMLRSRGVTRRANSAVALEAPTDLSALEQAVTRLEGLAEAAEAPSVFRILDGHGPEQLDAHLAERGYLAEGHSEIHERVLDGAWLPAPHPQARISTGSLDDEWFAHAWRLAPREGEDARRTVRDIMAGTPAAHVALPAGAGEGDDEEDDIVAVGRAALVESGRSTTAVLNAIAVDPAHRRQGLGTAVVGSLLALGAAQGARRALLEVERNNEAARLYRGLGLRRIAAYHYRVRR